MHALERLKDTQCGPLLSQLAEEFPHLAQRVGVLAEAVIQDIAKRDVVRKPVDTVVAASLAAVVPFVSLRDVSGLVPRGKLDLDFSEQHIVLRNKSDPNALLISVSNVTGVFSLLIQDKYRKGPEGCTHVAVISLRDPLYVGKTAHSTLAFVENGAKLAKGGLLSIALSRQPLRDLLRDPVQVEGATVEGSDQFDVLRRLLACTCGRIGTSDLGIFRSAGGLDCIKAYSKTSDGLLFPLRRLEMRVLCAFCLSLNALRPTCTLHSPPERFCLVCVRL